MNLTAVLESIERNLAGDLSVEALARRSGVSPYHFHRSFHAAVGEAPKQYVRRLRLELAATLLKLTTRSVTDIAFGVGYETHEGFTRAFSAHFGVPPRRFRAARPMPNLPPGFAPRIESLPPRRVAYLRYVGPYDRAALAFDRLAAWAAPRGLLGDAMLVSYWDDQDITAPSRTRCEVSVEVGDGVEGSGAVHVRDIPGGDYAIFDQVGDVCQRRRFYEAAYRRWLPSMRRHPAAAPPFEVYAFTPRGPDQIAARIHIPLRRR